MSRVLADERTVVLRTDLVDLVVSADEHAVHPIRLTFSDIAVADSPRVGATEFDLTRDEGAWRVHGPNAWGVSFTNLTAAIDALVSAVNLCVLDKEPDRLHVHAAALDRNGKGMLVVGGTGTGKTTLAAALARSGWTYLTDEMVGFDGTDAEAHTYPKPLSIKPGGRALLDGLIPHLVDPDGDHRATAHLPAGPAGLSTARSTHIDAVIFLQPRPPGTPAPPTAITIHPVDAVVSLLDQTMDAARFGEAAVDVLAHLAAGATCVSMVSGGLEDTIGALTDVVASRPEPVRVECLGPSRLVPERTRTVVIGDRCVLHDVDSGRAAALDVPGSAVWRRIGGWQPFDARIDLDGPIIRDFVSRLEALGFLDTDRSTSHR